MQKKLLILCVLIFIFGFTGIAGATRFCQPPGCPPDTDFNLWYDIEKRVPLQNNQAVTLKLDITPKFDPRFDFLSKAVIVYKFKGTPDTRFGYSYDALGDRWRIDQTRHSGYAFAYQRLGRDSLHYLSSMGFITGNFIARWRDSDSKLILKKAYLLAKGCDNPVPEPATMLLLGSGLVAIAGFGRKKFRNKRRK